MHKYWCVGGHLEQSGSILHHNLKICSSATWKMYSNIHSSLKEEKRNPIILYPKCRNLILTLFFLWISSELKFLQRLFTLPSILILIEIHILVRYAALSNFSSQAETLSTAINAIPVVHSTTCSGHPGGKPDQ